MSYSVCFDLEKNRYHIKYNGPITYDDIREVFLAVLDYPEFKKSMDMLLEIESFDEIAPFDDAIRFGDFQDSVADRRGHGFRSAVVFSDEKNFSYMQELVAYAKSTEAEFIVVKTLQEAIDWLDGKEY